ncbi:hypothetical protein ACFY05_29425 [Microtetraspora fusca]|uniref:DUF4259 domain-containing protein n=1 Tax=Microtetraspora fusca TaxID=1997 RepID=A0ABW6VDH3_MICFU
MGRFWSAIAARLPRKRAERSDPGEVEIEAIARGIWPLLLEALRHLALPAHEQIRWIGRMCVDELALDFDDRYQVSWAAQEMGWISAELSRHLDEIDRRLSQLSDEGEAPWSEEGLCLHPTWASVRELADRAIALMPPEPWLAEPPRAHP